MMNLQNLTALSRVFGILINDSAYVVAFFLVGGADHGCPFYWFCKLSEEQISDTEIQLRYATCLIEKRDHLFGFNSEQFLKLFGSKPLHMRNWSAISSPANEHYSRPAVVAELHARRLYLENIITNLINEDPTEYFNSIRPSTQNCLAGD